MCNAKLDYLEKVDDWTFSQHHKETCEITNLFDHESVSWKLKDQGLYREVDFNKLQAQLPRSDENYMHSISLLWTHTSQGQRIIL